MPAEALCAEARVVLANPKAMLERICDHFVEHGTVTKTESGARIDSPLGNAVLKIEGDALNLRAECPSEPALFLVKSSLAEHIFMFAEGETPSLVWAGNGAASDEVPYFRAMQVIGKRQISPNMRRVTLKGDAAHFAKGGLHARVLIPPRGRVPVWPKAGPDGRVIWPKGEDELTGRIYTIRKIREADGEVDVDVVLHGSSPGSVWAMTAEPGDPVGLMGPGGGEAVAADSYVLAGDETALPAIARLAEELPLNSRIRIFLEIAGPEDEQQIAARPGLDLVWLHRNGAEAGTSGLLEAALLDLDWPESDPPYVLVGCEHKAARAIRRHVRKTRNHPKTRHLIAAYWRRGYQDATDEDRH